MERGDYTRPTVLRSTAYARSCRGPETGCWRAPTEALAHELVAQPVNRQDVLRDARVRFELLPQPRDVDIDRARRRRGVVAPHLGEQLLARNRRAAVLDEIAEEVKLLGRELDGDAVLA